VTGGATGLGFATAEALLAEGRHVVICGRRDDVLKDAAARLADAHPSGVVQTHRADVAVPEQVSALVDAISRDHGRIAGLVHAAGMTARSSLPSADLDAWDDVHRVNLRGAYTTGAAVAAHMKDGGGGRIVLIGSTAGVASFPGGAAYATTKAAISALGRSMAVELAQYGIATNTVAPGLVRTPLTEPSLPTTNDYLERLNPLKRLGEPHEVANLVKYLVTEAPLYLTGATILIDGGQTARLAGT
jgi:NAD(P)-dependent dehydrogenase (short-subunit alcohol dehydrogenase family)